MIIGNNNTRTVSNTHVIGNNNIIRGHHNTITGSNNFIYGHCNIITGSTNDVIGNENTVTGSNNTICGRLNKAAGTNNDMKGVGNEYTDGQDIGVRSGIISGDVYIDVNGDITVTGNTDREPKFIALPEGTDTAVADEGPACVICMERESICALLPCAHRILCVQCSRELANGKTKGSMQCPECRAPVKKIARIYH